MHSGAHLGWLQPPWHVHTADRMIALLFSAQTASSLFHEQYRSDPTKKQTLVLHDRGKPLAICGLQEAFYSPGKMIKDERGVQLILHSGYTSGRH